MKNEIQAQNDQKQNKTASPSLSEKDINNSEIHIIHFNDCYNIEPGPKSSGAAGFLTAVNQLRHLDPMILFSGDIISPSFMSTFTKGEQMIPVLNDIGVHCAVFGNHEFDYGVDNLIDFVKKTTFPWLLSNVIDKETANQLGDGQVFHILQRGGLKFGLIGLIEEEWLSTLSTLDSSDVIYEDFVVRGRDLAKWLKSEPHNVDFVIALTHSRTPNDIRLADNVPEIDLILGGHDHDYEIIKRPNGYIIKSGTDFREFSKITLRIDSEYVRAKNLSNGIESSSMSPVLGIDIERVPCFSYEPNKDLKLKLDKFVTTIDEKMDKVLGQFNCDLDGRFASIRKTETNLGNFVTDIMLASTHADLAILNSGTLRSDRIHPKGDFTMRDLFNILGYIDPIAVLQASGHQIWQALENGVSQWPKLEGRFPQVSGCTFAFDPSKPPMSRIEPRDITIGDEVLSLNKQYRLTTKAYLASGKDGYDVFKNCRILVPGDESPDLTTSILNHFESIQIIKSNRRTHHRQSIICLSRNSLQKILDQTFDAHQQATLQQSAKSESDSQYTPTSFPCSRTEIINKTFSLNNSRSILQSQISESNDSRMYCSDSTKFKSTNDENNNNDSDRRDSTDINASGEAADTFGDEPVNLSNGLHGHLRPTASSPLVGTTPPMPSFDLSSRKDYTGASSPISDATTPSSIRNVSKPKKRMSLYELEQEQCQLEPKIEGRIRILGVNF